MENFLRDRIKERLDALDMNAFEAARRAGAERSFLHDLLIGKKETIRPSAIRRVAEVLDCDPEYLVGAQGSPRKLPPNSEGMMPLAGICEPGVWRAPGAIQSTLLPVSPDPRYAPDRQAAYLIRGHHADDLGLMDGDVLIAIRDEAVRSGDVVVIRQRRASGEAELTVRRIGDEPTSEGSEIVGRVIFAHRTFGK